MPARYVIGMDRSTTATKAVVWDMDGNAVAEGRATFPLSSPQPGWGEQNAEDWWRSTRDALRQAAGSVDPDQIGAWLDSWTGPARWSTCTLSWCTG